ncbi:glycosyltransferase family 2 protein [Loigolactobacillus binensis]|uniref:Glycosyltransferase family 2 protein n=1 Tax=Loigolactobacillus binensis TaxID=2559922 RepID=A0ABW3EDQ2_9LACO|nr:glycosyltransferase family 2 protein [Loigolactobacillus binensis]
MLSVCMATYNGAATVARQLTSILAQLTAADEVVIVDDRSQDETVAVIKKVAAASPVRVQILVNAHNQGPVKSFARALEQAQGELVFLADQDDYWYANKVAQVVAAFKQQKADLIVHDARVVDGQMQLLAASWNAYNHNRLPQSLVGNLLKNGYTGAMMAISQRLLRAALPFPEQIEMHDQWLFLVAQRYHLTTVVLRQPLMDYVRHGNNVTGMHSRSWGTMAAGRWQMWRLYHQLPQK